MVRVKSGCLTKHQELRLKGRSLEEQFPLSTYNVSHSDTIDVYLSFFEIFVTLTGAKIKRGISARAPDIISEFFSLERRSEGEQGRTRDVYLMLNPSIHLPLSFIYQSKAESTVSLISLR